MTNPTTKYSSAQLLIFLRKGYFVTRILFAGFILLGLFGCNVSTKKQEYESKESCITVEHSTNWTINYYERNGTIIFNTEQRLFSKDSARIEIWGNACFHNPIGGSSITEELYHRIMMLEDLYSLPTVTIIQEPVMMDNSNYTVYKSTIEIPIKYMPEDSPRIQVGREDNEASQAIEIFIISNDETNIEVYLFKGDNSELNTQAEEIINSIQFTGILNNNDR